MKGYILFSTLFNFELIISKKPRHAAIQEEQLLPAQRGSDSFASLMKDWYAAPKHEPMTIYGHISCPALQHCPVRDKPLFCKSTCVISLCFHDTAPACTQTDSKTQFLTQSSLGQARHRAFKLFSYNHEFVSFKF